MENLVPNNENNDFKDIIDFFFKNVSNEKSNNIDNNSTIESLIDYFQKSDIFYSESDCYETHDSLKVESLNRLFDNKICAIHISNYISKDIGDTIFNNIKNDLSDRKWEDTDMFQGYGLPVNHMYGPTSDDCINYFAQVLPLIRKLRTISGGISPIDKLRLELDEIWTNGAKISNNNPFNRKAFVGLTRLMKPEGLVGVETKKNGLIHIDGPLKLITESGSFSSNIYLKTPSNGGELCIWNVSMTMNNSENIDKLQKLLDFSFDKKYREKIQNILQKILPKPIIIKPQQGDLIILNSGKPHAVKGFDYGIRLSMQTFIHFQKDKPLELYS